MGLLQADAKAALFPYVGFLHFLATSSKNVSKLVRISCCNAADTSLEIESPVKERIRKLDGRGDASRRPVGW